MEFKLIALDLDGTLLDSEKRMSPRTMRAIALAVDQGVNVTLCTGRMFASTYPFAEDLGLAIPLITYNGALVKNSQNGEVLYQKHVPLEHARYIIELCRQYNCQLNVYSEDRLYVEQEGEVAKQYANKIKVPLYAVDDLAEFLKEPPTKLMAIGDQEVLKEIRGKLEGREIYMTRSHPRFLELLNPQATKGKGLEVVAQSLGIQREDILAMGDNYNDIEMFKYAGFSVAMENSEEHVKSYANYITATNDDEGVAQAIEELILGKGRV